MNTKALRQKILDLAIHGKLVPQNPNDESATVLLEKIRAEKAEKIKKGELKADKKDSFIFTKECEFDEDKLGKCSSGTRHKRHYEQFADGTVKDIEDEIPFDVSEGWAWCRLGNIGEYKKGPFGSSLTKSMFVPKSENTVKVYEQKNAIQKDHSLGEYYITRDYFESQMQSFEVFPGDILVSCAGTIGETYILPDNIEQGIINQALMKMKITSLINTDYFLMFFDHILKEESANNGKGTAIKNIPPFDIFKNFLFPLPSYSEQKRIIESVNNIFSIIDNLENNKSDLQSLIKNTKSKILDLAIHGKLVPQDPNDEPAEELLKRIATSDNRPYEKMDTSELDWSLPNNWCLCHFGDIATVINGKNQSKVENPDGKYPIYGSGGIMGRADDFICPENCTIIGRKGSINNPIFVEEKFWNVDTAFGLSPSEAVLPRFLFYFCEYFDFTTLDSSTTLPSLTKTNIQQIIFALPPIEEQKRILDKTEELFRKLDEIVLNLI